MVELSTFCLVARRCCTVRGAEPDTLRALPLSQQAALSSSSGCHFWNTSRRLPQGWLSKLLNYGYWVGTIALRLGLQPYLLVRSVGARRTLAANLFRACLGLLPAAVFIRRRTSVSYCAEAPFKPFLLQPARPHRHQSGEDRKFPPESGPCSLRAPAVLVLGRDEAVRRSR